MPCATPPLPATGEIHLTVNRETRQRANLAQMIWSPAEVVNRLSMQYRLHAGDLIFTGTPAGIAAVKVGDVVRVQISSLCELQVRIGERSVWP